MAKNVLFVKYFNHN